MMSSPNPIITDSGETRLDCSVVVCLIVLDIEDIADLSKVEAETQQSRDLPDAIR